MVGLEIALARCVPGSRCEGGYIKRGIVGVAVFVTTAEKNVGDLRVVQAGGRALGLPVTFAGLRGQAARPYACVTLFAVANIAPTASAGAQDYIVHVIIRSISNRWPSAQQPRAIFL